MKRFKKITIWGWGARALWGAALVGATGCVPVGGAAVGSVGLEPSAVTSVIWVDVAAAQDRKPVSLRFQEGARASGFAGCNGYGSQVAWSEEALTFSKTTTTRMLCEPEAMDTEQRYLQALAATRSARIDKGVLELLGGQRKVLWRFKPLP